MKPRYTFAFVTLLFGGYAVVTQAGKDHESGLSSYDKRLVPPALTAELTQEQVESLQRLQTRSPGIKASFEPILGTVRYAASASGFLSGPSSERSRSKSRV